MSALTPTMNPSEAPPRVNPASKARTVDRVLIRSYPKAVFLYPAALCAFVAGVATSLNLGGDSTWGMLFLLVLGMNVVIIAFEFPRTTSLTMLFLAVAAVLGAILLNQRFVIFPFLERQTRQLDPAANAQFYWLTAIGLTVILFTVWFVHRWVDYWEVLSNELIHHHGVLGNIERLPAPGIKLEKEITDVFEFLCLGAGRLVITVPNEGRAIVLENVPRINRVEHDIKEVLGVTEVEINQG